MFSISISLMYWLIQTVNTSESILYWTTHNPKGREKSFMLWSTHIFARKLNAGVVFSPSQTSYQQPILMLFSQSIQWQLKQTGNYFSVEIQSRGFPWPGRELLPLLGKAANMLTVLCYIHHHLLGKEDICKASFCQSAFSWLVKWNSASVRSSSTHCCQSFFSLYKRAENLLPSMLILPDQNSSLWGPMESSRWWELQRIYFSLHKPEKGC